jgi:hypothetical protein
VEIPSSSAIGFSNAFVDGVTKADPTLTIDSLTTFKVNGYVSNGTESSQIFQDVVVTKQTNGDWTYETLRYWIDGGNYVFGAYLPTNITGTVTTAAAGTAGNLVTTIAGFVSNGETDLLYASPTPIEKATSTGMAKVSLDFNHMLSKVIFTFKNGFAAKSDVQLSVKNVKINDAYAKADVQMRGAQPAQNNDSIIWSNWSEATLSLDFGKAPSSSATDTIIAPTKSFSTENARLIIPTGTTKTYSVTFDVNVYGGASPILLNTYKDVTANITPEEAFVPGYSYNFIATLDSTNTNPKNHIKPIEFTVNKVEKWANATDGTLNVPAVTTTSKDTNENNSGDTGK